MKAVPSEAWRNEVFSSPERINVLKNGKSTTRHPVAVGWSGQITYANGGHERIAQLILEQLWAEGLVRRWKAQPFNLKEIGGPDAVPDLLAELESRALHVIQVKAKRFLTEEVTARFDLQRAFLEPKGFTFHIWTNADILSSQTSHTVNELERGRRYPASPEMIATIKAAAEKACTVGDLLAQFGWDDVLSAAAQLAFHFNITQPIHESTPLLRHHSSSHYAHLFTRGSATANWWETLAPSKV